MSIKSATIKSTSDYSEKREATKATIISKVDAEVGASIIASGIGAVTLGVAIVLVEVSLSIKEKLVWVDGVGPLSGKTGVAVIAFLLSWVILHFVMKSKPIDLMKSVTIGGALLFVSLLLTFPPVFEELAKLFGAE
jgi:hypothetical protein